MRIMMDVQDRLVWTPDNQWKTGIQSAVKSGIPYIKIIQEIKEQALSNRGMVEGQIGLRLTNEILNF